MNLQGKVALITGGRRVGGELAKLLADRGMSIAMTYHTRPEAIERTLDEIRIQGGKGFAISADLSDASQAERAVAETVGTFGRIDVLVNMASVYRRTPFEDLVAADFNQMIAANLAAPYFTAVSAARQMRRQAGEDGLKGKIVNVGDWATDRPYRDYLPYLTSKGALKTFTFALAKELAPEVTVNLVQPAMIDPASRLHRGRQSRGPRPDTPPSRGDTGRFEPLDPVPSRRDGFRHRLVLSRGRRPIPWDE